MTAPYLGSTGMVRIPRRIICFKVQGSAIYGSPAVRLAQRLLRQANDLWMLGESAPGMRLTTLKGQAHCGRAGNGIQYATLLSYPDGHVPADQELMPPTGIRSANLTRRK